MGILTCFKRRAEAANPEVTGSSVALCPLNDAGRIAPAYPEKGDLVERGSADPEGAPWSGTRQMGLVGREWPLGKLAGPCDGNGDGPVDPGAR